MGAEKNYTFRDFDFGGTILRYVIMKETGAVFMLLLPKGMQDSVWDAYETVKIDEPYPDHRDWFPGSLVHLHLSHHINSCYGNSYKFSESTAALTFKSQEVTEGDGFTEITTVLVADEGYSVRHVLRRCDGENGFEVKNIFCNNTGKRVRLEMISSGGLDGLCPFNGDDSSEGVIFHTFRGGWAIEGKRESRRLCELNMEKSWGGSFESERIGSIGTKSVGRYFPYAALEDTKSGCTWGIRLKHNATWQIELTRCGKDLSLTAGIGDLSFGSWFKDIDDGASFETPVCCLAAVKGGIAELSDAMLKMSERDADSYGEKGMPILFNEWCTTWGKPSHGELTELAAKSEHGAVKYLVMDAGWYDGVVGDWTVKKEAFPNGLKALCGEIRKRGMIPGIWMEFECVRKGARLFGGEYDDLFLKKFGKTIVGTVSNQVPTKFLDFRKKEVRDYLQKSVIDFLKENGFGYLKVDYNSNVGIGCDGAESLGEGLRQHMSAVHDFFVKIKQEIPEIIIENCASGGSRLDPETMGITAMSSFSDAHESHEIPVIAANMHYLVPPRQSQIWCVLKPEFDKAHMQYIVSAGFLGRLCWSGMFTELYDWQLEIVRTVEALYERVSGIIKDGFSRIYRTDEPYNCRSLKGTQAVMRRSRDGESALVVYHTFAEPRALVLDLERSDYAIDEDLFGSASYAHGGKLFLDVENENCGNVLLLKRKNQ